VTDAVRLVLGIRATLKRIRFRRLRQAAAFHLVDELLDVLVGVQDDDYRHLGAELRWECDRVEGAARPETGASNGRGPYNKGTARKVMLAFYRLLRKNSEGERRGRSTRVITVEVLVVETKLPKSTIGDCLTGKTGASAVLARLWGQYLRLRQTKAGTEGEISLLVLRELESIRDSRVIRTDSDDDTDGN
jgi:hypothetical protein